MAQPRQGVHYDPKGRGSMLKVGDELSLVPTLFPYLDRDGKTQWSLGLVSNPNEMAAIEQKLAAAQTQEDKEDVLDSFKAISFSQFFTVYPLKTPNGSIKFQIEATTILGILEGIPTNSTTTEESFANAWNMAISTMNAQNPTTPPKTKAIVTDSIIALSKSDKEYLRASKIELA